MIPVRKWARRPRSAVAIGIIVSAVTAVLVALIYQQNALRVAFTPGDTVQAEFSQQHRLLENQSKVKMAGVVVGTVDDIEQTPRGTALVSMKLYEGTIDKLGSQPSARIRPTTLLGGNYYVHLERGGDETHFGGKPIPLDRTTSPPVELDGILRVFQSPARNGLQSATRQLDRTLARGGQEAVERLLRDLPGTLRPASKVVPALRGTRPTKDLNELVSNVDALATVLTKREGQLGDTVDSLAKVSATLSATSRPLSNTVASLPDTLTSTRAGLDSLRGTLVRTTKIAADLRPVAQQLDPLLAKTNPVLQRARPLVRELRSLLRDARPMVQQLVPTAERGTRTLNALRGPVINRVKGPILKTVLSPWKGSGYYQGNGGGDHPAYKELGYLMARGAMVSQYGDKNGAMIGLALGAGTTSPHGGAPLTMEQLLEFTGIVSPGSLPGTTGSPIQPQDPPSRRQSFTGEGTLPLPPVAELGADNDRAGR